MNDTTYICIQEIFMYLYKFNYIFMTWEKKMKGRNKVIAIEIFFSFFCFIWYSHLQYKTNTILNIHDMYVLYEIRHVLISISLCDFCKCISVLYYCGENWVVKKDVEGQGQNICFHIIIPYFICCVLYFLFLLSLKLSFFNYFTCMILLCYPLSVFRLIIQWVHKRRKLNQNIISLKPLE